jgi:hypothetical protein
LSIIITLGQSIRGEQNKCERTFIHDVCEPAPEQGGYGKDETGVHVHQKSETATCVPLKRSEFAHDPPVSKVENHGRSPFVATRMKEQGCGKAIPALALSEQLAVVKAH